MAPTRELTTLEYIVLGLVGQGPQSGYSIIGALEVGTNRWSASPGSIYPILKRLEQAEYIAGELEHVHETRPRKMYTLTEHGATTLDDWLRGPLSVDEVLDGHDVALVKFLFAESRLPSAEVIDWLDRYAALTDQYDAAQRLFADEATGDDSLHRQLLRELTLLEINTMRTWIELARRRLQDTQS